MKNSRTSMIRLSIYNIKLAGVKNMIFSLDFWLEDWYNTFQNTNGKHLEMSRSWSSAHDWKSCIPQKGIESSNLSISANEKALYRKGIPPKRR